MTFQIANRVHETTTTKGTGTVDLGGAVAGAQTFITGIGTGNTTFYIIADDDDWEIGVGTVTAGSPNTLSRDTVLASSNGGLLVNWVTGTRNVFCNIPSSKMVFGDDNGNVAIGSAALATTATDGFLYVPTCAGTPTGVPTSKGSTVPIVFDSTNNKLYVYDGSWLSTAALT